MSRIIGKTAIIAVCLVAVMIGCVKIHHDKQLRAEWETDREIITVRVSDGDTLDEFGYEYKPEWMDVREYREQVKELNDMTSSAIRVGQELKLYA